MSAPQPLWKPSSSGLTKTPDSGKLTLGDRSTLVDSWEGLYSNCLLAVYARGARGTADRADWVCTQSDVTPERGNKAKLTITWEAAGPNALAQLTGTANISMPLPTNDFDLQTQELYPKVERNSFFSGITSATLALAYSAAQASTPAARNAAATKLAGLSDPQKSLGQGLAAKLLSGEETFYMAGLRYTWWTFSWTVPSLNLGGTITTPDGPLTGYFGSIAFLQLADALAPAGVNGSMFKKTKTFLGGPAGHWDSDLY